MFLMIPKNFNGWDVVGFILMGFCIAVCWGGIAIPLIVLR